MPSFAPRSTETLGSKFDRVVSPIRLRLVVFCSVASTDSKTMAVPVSVAPERHDRGSLLEVESMPDQIIYVKCAVSVAESIGSS